MKMEFLNITAKDNKLIKKIKKLVSSASFRREDNSFVLEGQRLVFDAVKNGYLIDTLVVSESYLKSAIDLDIVANQKVLLPDSLFKSLCDTVNPQGILCVAKMPDTVCDIEKIEKGKYIILENTQDPANLGAIARTAEALGLSGLIVSTNGCDPFSPKAQRAAMGALVRFPLYLSQDISADIKSLQKKGFSVFASVVSDADCNISDVSYDGSCAVIIGNEANGVTEQLKSVADKKITIPMGGRAESLNAAAAAAIIIWEMVK